MPEDPFDFLRPAMRMRNHRVGIAVVAALMISGIVAGAIIAQTTLTAPGVFNSALVENCDPVDPSPSVILENSSGFIVWGCGDEAAFDIIAAGIPVTPTIIAGPEWTSTYVYKVTGTPPSPGLSCASAGIVRLITDGVAVTFASTDVGGWNYCSDYTDAPMDMTDINYSWDQAQS